MRRRTTPSTIARRPIVALVGLAALIATGGGAGAAGWVVHPAPGENVPISGEDPGPYPGVYYDVQASAPDSQPRTSLHPIGGLRKVCTYADGTPLLKKYFRHLASTGDLFSVLHPADGATAWFTSALNGSRYAFVNPSCRDSWGAPDTPGSCEHFFGDCTIGTEMHLDTYREMPVPHLTVFDACHGTSATVPSPVTVPADATCIELSFWASNATTCTITATPPAALPAGTVVTHGSQAVAIPSVGYPTITWTETCTNEAGTAQRTQTVNFTKGDAAAGTGCDVWVPTANGSYALTVTNTGGTTWWGPDYCVLLSPVACPYMAGFVGLPVTICLNPGELVAPGQRRTFTGIGKAPDVPIRVTMVNAAQQNFGSIPQLDACLF
jgi:hypothetical protein